MYPHQSVAVTVNLRGGALGSILFLLKSVGEEVLEIQFDNSGSKICVVVEVKGICSTLSIVVIHDKKEAFCRV